MKAASSVAEATHPAPGVSDAIPASDVVLVQKLKAGDERAFLDLVDRYADQMLRVALLLVPTRTEAEEAVQDTWLALLSGIHRFQGRCSVKTWIFAILKYRAKNRAKVCRRTVPFTSLDADDFEEPEERFRPRGDRYEGRWASAPQDWASLPEDRLLSAETIGLIKGTIASLRPTQRAVIRLRDVEGWDAAEVCELLQISPANQRVLLHRARSNVRSALESYLATGDGGASDET